jgi:hypothetical protein
MKNLNKFTKSELINKYKNLENEKTSNKTIINQFISYLHQFCKIILTFKNFLLKLTLITFFIKILKNYRILRKIWTILNTIIVTIFGISLLDNFGIGYLQLFLREIRFVTGNIIEYLTNTHFYKYLTKLFSREDEASSKETNKNGSMMESNIRETTRNEENIRENYRTSKISEIIRGEEIKAEDESKSNNNKYYIIVGVLIASALVWYYSEELKTGGASLIDWIKSFFPGDDPNNNPREHLNRRARINVDNNEKVRFKESVITHDDNNVQSSSKVKLEDFKGKGKLTSSSLDDLVNQSQESWLEDSSSTSSDETIKPLSENQLRDISSIKEQLKIYLPDEIIEEMNYVESKLPLSNLEDASELGRKMADIKTSNVQFKNLIESQRKDGKPELLIEVAEENYKNLEKWIEKTIKEIEKHLKH